MIEIFRPKRLS